MNKALRYNDTLHGTTCGIGTAEKLGKKEVAAFGDMSRGLNNTVTDTK